MSFTGDLKAFTGKVEQRNRAIFVGSVSAVQGSVVDGSAVTGAPGQPVDTGFLRSAWQATFPGEWLGQVAAYNVEYAEAIEEGQQPPYVTPNGTQITPRPMTLRSAVGGFHSRKMTIAGWVPLMRSVVTEVVG